MSNHTIRTTFALPSDLLAAADRAVREERARSRNELVATALRHELEALEHDAIDAAFAPLADDADHHAETRILDAEFATAGWEAFQYGEEAM